jgi:hypothetical protein
MVIQNNLYIVGFATSNLRYDPVDEALYVWGWDAPLPTCTAAANAAASTNPIGTYRYRLSWVDLYTGEESELSDPFEVTTTAALPSVLLNNFVAYGGTRQLRSTGPTSTTLLTTSSAWWSLMLRLHQWLMLAWQWTTA